MNYVRSIATPIFIWLQSLKNCSSNKKIVKVTKNYCYFNNPIGNFFLKKYGVATRRENHGNPGMSGNKNDWEKTRFE